MAIVATAGGLPASAAMASSGGSSEPPDSAVGAAVGGEAGGGDADGGGLSEGGAEFAAAIDWASQPEYVIDARLDPASGEVEATMSARLPIGTTATSAMLRWFPGAVADHAAVTSVRVDGADVAPAIEDTILTVALPEHHATVVRVDVEFGFTADKLPAASSDPMSGAALDPAAICLLARSDTALTLGHWFPIWIPDGFDSDPDLDGFGDISNFPAARIEATLDVPDGAAVVTGGVRIDERPIGSGRVEITEGATGLRDLAVVVVPDAQQVEVATGDVRIVVTAPPGSTELDAVADLAATSVSTLGAELGPYPWTEFDVVSSALGSSVGGMEWPGMVWIESTVFDGGVPGLGELGDVVGGDLDELFGELDDVLGSGTTPDLSTPGDSGPESGAADPGLGDLGLDDLGLGDLGLGDIALTMETMREWTIAHEVGHMWWHALVGNDSVAAPVVDEALAQHSACLVERVLRDADADAVCDANTSGQFEQLAMWMGVTDGAADRATDEFASSTEYGALVYGKAPGFYRELERVYGVDATTAALAAVVADHAFEQITSDELRDALGTALGDPVGVEALWRRWMTEAHGVEDLS